MSLTWTRRQVRVLDFDLECRPLNFYGGDFVGKEITAIGAQFIGSKERHCFLLGPMAPESMLEEFRSLWDATDMVCGHYIRAFDLPLIVAAQVELDMRPLGRKLSSDTKLDLIKFSGLSKSQENLAATLGIKAPKVQMNQAKWRAANRLLPEGIAETRKRVLGDVTQNIALRKELIRRGMLGPPKVWRPEGRSALYAP